MSFSIKWSPRALSDITKLLEYLENNWGKDVAREVLDKIEDDLNTIVENPELYPYFIRKEEIHRCVITSQTTLYYRKTEDIIELITFWDSRQNPENFQL